MGVLRLGNDDSRCVCVWGLSLSRWFVSSFAGFSIVRSVLVLDPVFLKTGSITLFLIESQSSGHYIQKNHKSRGSFEGANIMNLRQPYRTDKKHQ